jgi:cytochrome c oxidase subunit II
VKTRSLAVALVAFAVAALALLVLVIVDWGGAEEDPRPEGRLARGEQIYLFGLDAQGRPLPRSDGMPMMRRGCASCHGPEGRGRTTPMFDAPDITYRNLTDPEGMREPDDERGHTYSDAEIRRAVTEGVGPDGEELSWPMPRWQLSNGEFEALIAYLKTL